MIVINGNAFFIIFNHLKFQFLKFSFYLTYNKIIDRIYVQCFDLFSGKDILEPICYAFKVPTTFYCTADDDGG